MKLRVKEFLDCFALLEKSKTLVQVSGRVLGVRVLGSKLQFADLYSEGHQVQIITDDSQLMRGDIVQVEGVAQMQKNPTIKNERLRVLQQCKDRNSLPSRKTGLSDAYLRMELRHVDLMYNSMQVFQKRSEMIRRLRELLHENGFIEVETPILSKEAGGALAEPFRTKRDVDDVQLYMRIAPELFLKRCVIGGMERVFEIGKVFRNEGMDNTHQPEFTMCEFYWAYSELEQVIQFVLNYLKAVGLAFDDVKRVDLVEEVEKATGLNVLQNDSEQKMFDLVKQIDPNVRNILPKHSLFDKLVSHFVEPKYSKGAVFFMNHPLFSSPLAQENPQKRGQASRFEMFVDSMEVANGYEELRDADEQLARFEKQARESGGTVAKGDREYVEALRMGLPPTVGCGLGIDRLVMLATGAKSIREVILFPHH